MRDILFWSFSLIGLIGGVGLITNRNPIYSVLYTILNFFAIGGLFLTLQAEFLAVVQIIVYAGAIMVLFLFVIMLLNLGPSDPEETRFDARKGIIFILGLAFLAELLFVFSSLGNEKIIVNEEFHFGKVEALGQVLLTNFVFPFEMISVILLAALIGAVAIARKHN